MEYKKNCIFPILREFKPFFPFAAEILQKLKRLDKYNDNRFMALLVFGNRGSYSTRFRQCARFYAALRAQLVGKMYASFQSIFYLFDKYLTDCLKLYL